MKTTSLALLVSGLVLAAAPARAQSAYPENTGSEVIDLAGVLTPAQEDSVRALLAPARDTGADVRVVTIGSIDDYASGAADIETFATGMFNTWRIGSRPENDGALLLVAVRDRKVRIELGDGATARFESSARELVDSRIVPRFREGDYAAGILAGAGEIARWYVDPPPAEAPPAGGYTAEAPDPSVSTEPVAQPYYIPPPRGPRREAIEINLALVFLVAVVAVFGAMAFERFRKRICPGCGAPMTRLDEAADDVHLDSGQRVEEMLASVDYDVWKCGACGNHTLLPYRSWLSSVKECRVCGYRTAATAHEVVERPTYESTGIERIAVDCRHCGDHHEHLVTLPRLTPPEDNDSYDTSSSRRSFSSSGSSSSSSGGGHSSGGGASGSW